jgi:hypothetical protein
MVAPLELDYPRVCLTGAFSVVLEARLLRRLPGLRMFIMAPESVDGLCLFRHQDDHRHAEDG